MNRLLIHDYSFTLYLAVSIIYCMNGKFCFAAAQKKEIQAAPSHSAPVKGKVQAFKLRLIWLM